MKRCGRSLLRRRSGRLSSTIRLQCGENGLAGDNAIADAHLEVGIRRQEHIHPRAELHQPDPLSPLEYVAFAHAADDAPGEDAVAFVKRLVGAWDCCGTCAGGVLAERDRAVAAAERERADAAEAKIAAVEALADEWQAEGTSLETHAHSGRDVFEAGQLQACARTLRAALGGEATP